MAWTHEMGESRPRRDINKQCYKCRETVGPGADEGVESKLASSPCFLVRCVVVAMREKNFAAFGSRWGWDGC